MSDAITPSDKNVNAIIVYISIPLILIGVPLLIHPSMMWKYHAPKELFLQFMLIIGITLQLAVYLKDSRIKLTINSLDLVFSARVILCLILYFFLAQYKSVPIKIDIILSLTLFYWLIQLSLMQSNSFEQFGRYLNFFLWTLFVVIIIEAVWGVIQAYQYHRVIVIRPYLVYKYFIQGTIGNANGLGGFIAAGIPLSLGLLSLTDAKYKRRIIFVGVIISFIALVLTKSRGSCLALVVGLIVFYQQEIGKYFKRFKSRFRKILIIFLLIGLLMTLLVYFFHINEASSKGRIFLAKISWLMIKEFPLFGIGYGNFSIHYPDYQAKFFSITQNRIYFDHAADIKQAHNEFLQLLAETGVIGFFVFMIMLFIFYKLCLRLVSSDHNTIFPRAGHMFMASTTVILVHSLVDCPLHILPIYLLFCFNLGMVSVAHKFYLSSLTKSDKDFRNTATISIPKRFRPLLFLIFIILVGIGCWQISRLNRTAKGYKLWKEGVILSYQSQWHKSINLYNEALAYIPHKGQLHYNLAYAYSMIGQYDLSLSEFVLARDNYTDMHIDMYVGEVYQNLEKYDLAEQSYGKMIASFPNLLEPKLCLAKLNYMTKKFADAATLLREIISIEPKIENEKSSDIKQEARDLLALIEEHD